MARTRTGARTFLDLLAKVCKLRHFPGFTAGLIGILGATDAADLIAVFDPLCVFVEFLIQADDFYNRVDATTPSVTGSEDETPA